jgi:uncharacterized protein (DUF1810 family)
MADTDSFKLARFVDAQKPVYETVLAELRAGYKQTHWMWFIFPQVEGLGQSFMSRYYSIKSLAEATAYLEHPTLGPRLLECSGILLELQGKPAAEIFGSPDDMKLCSSMTLFDSLKDPNPVFASVLDEYYAGKRDHKTLQLLAGRR